jgi:hypothetical protein
VTSLPSPASPGKPKLGESNGDREYLMQVLRAATARVKLTSNTLDSIDPLFDSIDSATGYQRPANAPTRPYYDIMPSTQDVRDYLGQPQTDAGKKAQTLGEILPFALGAPVAMRHMAGKAMGPIADTLGSYMPPEALWSLLGRRSSYSCRMGGCSSAVYETNNRYLFEISLRRHFASVRRRLLPLPQLVERQHPAPPSVLRRMRFSWPILVRRLRRAAAGLQPNDNAVSSTAGTLLPANWVEVLRCSPAQRVSAISNEAGTFSLSITELTD